MGTVFRKYGKFLRCSGYTTHTGEHHTTEWVDDLQQATVFYTLPSQKIITDEQLADADWLPAMQKISLLKF